MKKIILSLAFAAALSSCNHKSETKSDASPATKDTTTEKSATPATGSSTAVSYQCPMKCEGEKTYAQMGKCPVCEMDLRAMN